MANQYTLTDAFSAISETQGTLYNVGDSNIELASAADTTPGQGIIFPSGATQTFRGTLYARSMDSAATLNVSDFIEAGEGGDVGDIRRPSTAYDVGALVDGAGLASGLALRCTTAGTTSSAALDCSGYELGDTITDGTAVWLVTEYVTLDEAGGISPRVTNSVDLGSASKSWRKLYAGRIDEGTYIPGAFNHKETFTTSGTFVAPVTGTYRITLQGGGGGGSGAGSAGTSIHFSGGGGGQGENTVLYEKLISGASYSYSIGAGGNGGAAGDASTMSSNGNDGGTTSITISGNTYSAVGGGGGTNGYNGGFCGGHGGRKTVNGRRYGTAGAGSPGMFYHTSGWFTTIGGEGGGNGGGTGTDTLSSNEGFMGGGGAGGFITGSGEYNNGGAGGDGYITFEYYDTNA